jgi:transposase
MSRKGSAEQLQARRLQAMALLEEGCTQKEVAYRLGVSPAAVSHWKKAHAQGGNDALLAQVHPGPKPKLSSKQCQRLLSCLKQGPRKHGWSTELWTLPRIAELIARKFGAEYDQSGVWRLLRRLGWSCQKPERRARQRDQTAIDGWRKPGWRRIKKRPPQRPLDRSCR